jgi:hypothetical protein
MSVGTWILSGFGSAIGAAAASELTGIARPVGRVAEAAAAVLGMPLATYTAALLSTTATPVWYRARRHLPFLFAAGSAASAGAAATLFTPRREAGMAARLAIGGALAEVAVGKLMERSLGEHAKPYHDGEASHFSKLALPLVGLGAAAMLAGRRSRLATLAGATSILTGSLLERLAVWQAGTDSARATLR